MTPRGGRHVLEGPVAPVTVEDVPVDSRHVEVGPAVVVEVAGGDAHRVPGAGDAGPGRDVLEREPGPGCGRAGSRSSRRSSRAPGSSPRCRRRRPAGRRCRSRGGRRPRSWARSGSAGASRSCARRGRTPARAATSSNRIWAVAGPRGRGRTARSRALPRSPAIAQSAATLLLRQPHLLVAAGAVALLVAHAPQEVVHARVGRVQRERLLEGLAGPPRPPQPVQALSQLEPGFDAGAVQLRGPPQLGDALLEPIGALEVDAVLEVGDGVGLLRARFSDIARWKDSSARVASPSA